MQMPRPVKNQPLARRLGFACAGIAAVLRRERSMRTQVALAAAALIVAAGLGAGPLWAAILALAIGLVLALELANAALEYTLDLLHPGVAAEIGRAKDAAAGAVLVASIAALAIGTAFLWSKLGGG